MSEEGCSAVAIRNDTVALLAQTWDTHATAAPYTMMLHVPARENADPSAAMWLLSVTGCLGMCGLNERGVGIAINNLHSRDAKIGVVWSAIVRNALAAPCASLGRDKIQTSQFGSGHHYVVADREHVFGIETSGALCKQVFDNDLSVYVHTNHCLDADLAAVSRVPPNSTTHDRYHWLRRSVTGNPVEDLEDMWSRLGSHAGYPRSICTNMSTPNNPHGTATCAAIAMDLRAKELLAMGGFVHNVRGLPFRF